jgi:stearoyl-CoA desaturase (delta-9 desaturase)
MTTLSTSAAAPQSKGYIAWAPLVWIATLHAGALLAFYPGFFTWGALAACLVGHWITGGIGICMTYHRLLTHRSFAIRPRWMEYVLTMIGCAASEGGAIGWVADHRRHHAFSDEEGDVHSPNQGFGWAHMFWWMTPDITSRHTPEYLKKWAPDLYKDPIHRFLNTWNVMFSIGSGVLMYAIGGMPWLVWGYFIRSILVLHTTWLVNSATHVWGYRSHETRDKSTNLWWVAALTYGEGWHNNHHAFQTSARHGLDWWEIDPTYITLKLLSYVGITYNLKLPKLDKNDPLAAKLEARDAAKATRKATKARQADGERELVGVDN